MILRRWVWAILIAMSCLFVGCDKDEAIIAPSEIVSGIENNQVDLKAGEAKLFSPSFDANGTLVYQWLLNGENVSDEKTYEFKSDAYGKHTLKFEVSNEAGKQAVEYLVSVNGTYSKGVFIVNEGWFGHEAGNVNFWDRESDDIIHKIYEKENPDKKLGVTTQFAYLHNTKLYLVSKAPANLVVVNSATMKELGRLSIEGTNLQARGFVAETDSKGYLSSSDGIFQIDISSYTVGAKLEGISGEVGNMLIVDGKLYALKAKELIIIDTADNTIEKTIPLGDKAGGMIKDKDNNIWIAARKQLLKVNTSDLSSDTIDLNNDIDINPSYGWAWNSGSLTYSKTNNTLYFMKKGGWSGIRTVACYNIATKEAKDLLTIDSDYMIYGAGTYIDPVSDKLYVTAIKGYGQAAKHNRLYIYDLDGNKEKTMDYEHFYFAALCVAND